MITTKWSQRFRLHGGWLAFAYASIFSHDLVWQLTLNELEREFCFLAEGTTRGSKRCKVILERTKNPPFFRVCASRVYTHRREATVNETQKRID